MIEPLTLYTDSFADAAAMAKGLPRNSSVNGW